MIESYPELDAERNERACRLILRDIAKHPQSNHSDVIVADDVLSSFGSPDRTAIDLRDIARIRPEAYESLYDVVTSVHEKFGVHYRPPLDRLHHVMRSTAANALDEVRHETAVARRVLKRAVPIVGMGMNIHDDYIGNDPRAGYMLHEVLAADPEVLEITKHAVKLQADMRRNGSRERQWNVVRWAKDRGYVDL